MGGTIGQTMPPHRDGSNQRREDRGYMKWRAHARLCRSVMVGCTAALALGLVAACSTKQPMPVMNEAEMAGMGAAEMLAAVEETTAAADGSEAVPDPELTADPEPDIMTEVMERYDALEATVGQLQSDVDNLNAGQTVFQTELRSLEGRVVGVEDSVEGMAERILTRFDNFDAEIGRIRKAISDMPPAGRRTPRAATPPRGDVTPEPEGPVSDIEAEGALAVDAWRQAWEARDVASYTAAYQEYAAVSRYGLRAGSSLRKRSLSRDGLRTRMELLVRQYARMEIGVVGFRVVEEEGRMVVTFQQNFSAWSTNADLKPAYADKGIKTLALVEQDGGGLIIKEAWVPVGQ